MSFLGGLIGGIGGLITGGPVGAVGGAIVGSRSNPFAGPTTPTTFPQGLPPAANPGFWNKLNPFQPGGFPGFGFGPKGLTGGKGRGRVSANSDGTCPSGYHRAKTGTGCVRNRHMNFGNGRATGRAIRRIRGAEKQYSHIFHMTHKKTGVRIKRKR